MVNQAGTGGVFSIRHIRPRWSKLKDIYRLIEIALTINAHIARSIGERRLLRAFWLDTELRFRLLVYLRLWRLLLGRLGRSFLFKPLLLEACFGDREEKRALKAVLLAVLAYWWFSVGEDVAPVCLVC